jgi:hypothetical protein
MPGLASLQEGAGRIGVAYQDLPNGGQITYTTSDPKLITAENSQREKRKRGCIARVLLAHSAALSSPLSGTRVRLERRPQLTRLVA